MFHRICKKEEKSFFKNNCSLENTPEYLEKIILYFKRRGYDFVSIGDVPRILNSAEKQRKKFVVFTFDDGYADNFISAYPVFRKYKVPFTLYVTTSFPDGNAVMWWYMLDELVLKNSAVEFDVHGTHYSFNCSDDQNKEASFMSILKIIQGSSASDSPRVIAAVFPKYGIDWRATSGRLAIGWDMIIEMSKDSLVTIGAHTVNHFALKNLSAQELNSELLQSKNIIESKINMPVKAFSYPFGGINEAGLREFDAVKRAGFETATTTRESNIFKHHKDHLASLPRINVNGNIEEFLEIECESGFVPFYRARGKTFVLE
jgi:peptidoglycan/xylan/chitin deacetylase (PgdA/CDA1 family)